QDGQSALFWGGSQGTGRALAQLMAQKVYRLAIIPRTLEGAKAPGAGDLGGGHFIGLFFFLIMIFYYIMLVTIQYIPGFRCKAR
uniref:Uncharacterized protein n=1 Tax=Ursus maritimus TaxID=29073 RepID=A0A452VG42_URSMA